MSAGLSGNFLSSTVLLGTAIQKIYNSGIETARTDLDESSAVEDQARRMARWQ